MTLPADLPHRTWGAGAARPLLALHCSLAHAGAWSALAPHLQGIALTAIDMPGHGRRPAWDGSADLHAGATRDAAAMAQGLGKGRPVDVMGHSFGATVALRLVLERPELVRSLILFEPVLFAAARAAGAACWPAFLAGQAHVRNLMQAGDSEGAARAFHAEWGDGARLEDLPARQRAYMVDRMPLIRAQDDALMGDSAGLLSWMRLESAGVPVLLAEGAESPPVIAAIADELARRLPQVRRLRVPGAGHMLPVTHAAQVAPAVQAHLAES